MIQKRKNHHEGREIRAGRTQREQSSINRNNSSRMKDFLSWNKIPKDKDGFFDEESNLYEQLPILITERKDECFYTHYIDEENWHDTVADLSRQRFEYYIRVEALNYGKQQ